MIILFHGLTEPYLRYVIEHGIPQNVVFFVDFKDAAADAIKISNHTGSPVVLEVGFPVEEWPAGIRRQFEARVSSGHVRFDNRVPNTWIIAPWFRGSGPGMRKPEIWYRITYLRGQTGRYPMPSREAYDSIDEAMAALIRWRQKLGQEAMRIERDHRVGIYGYKTRREAREGKATDAIGENGRVA